MLWHTVQLLSVIVIVLIRHIAVAVIVIGRHNTIVHHAMHTLQCSSLSCSVIIIVHHHHHHHHCRVVVVVIIHRIQSLATLASVYVCRG